MSAEPSSLMRPDASTDAICAYPLCRVRFAPRKPWQRFHSTECRHAFHRTQTDGGLRGTVKSVRLLKRGEVSITLRFGIEEREEALRMEPGKLAEIL